MRRPANLILLLAISVWLALSSFSLLALAQEPAPFEIRVIPQAEYAVAGQPFTYTVVVTNVSQDSVNNIAVKAQTPPGTTFIKTDYTNINWAARRPEFGSAGEIFWITVESVAPSEVISFSLVVEVPADIDQAALINEGYIVAIGHLDNLIASGPSIKTQVVTSPPSPTATPLPPPTVTVTPLELRPTSLSESARNAAHLSDTPTSTTQSKIVVTTVTPSPKSTSRNISSGIPNDLLTVVMIIFGGVVAVLIAIGLSRFLRSK